MREIIESVAHQLPLQRNNIREFLSEVFDRVSKHYNLCKNYQARAAKFGEAFEICFKVIIDELYPNLEFSFAQNVELPEACMVKGGNADFAVLEDMTADRRVIAIIETKGAADRIICGDEIRKLPRPGMLRTDTVKKAISNAYQASRAFPKSLFFIVASHVPTGGNAKCMCDLAEGDIVDKIVDITNPSHLDEMIKMIREAITS